MTLEEAKKLKKGTLIKLINANGMGAKPGATAVSRGVSFSVILNTELLVVTWVRNHLDGKQNDGGYHPRDFEVVSETQNCNCSAQNLAKYGCRYLKSPNSEGLVHI